MEPSTRLPVHMLFRHAARENATATAITGRTEVVSYEELEFRMRAFAGLLQGLGVKPGEVVAVEDGGTPASIAALLGVLYSGCVVMPLDPDTSRERRAAADARYLVRATTDGWSVFETSEDGALRVVAEDVTWRQPAPLAEPVDADGPRAPAYVFVTSGSTGRPKAVLGAHGALSHFVCWQRDRFGIGPDDRFGQLTSWSFDVVLRDVLTPLTSGAAVCLPGTRSRTAGRVFSFAREHDVTALHVVPSLARRWLATGEIDHRLPALRAAFFAGEPLPADLVHAWRARVAPSSRVVNLYGPTETTLAKCFYEVPPVVGGGGQVPVGRPLPECEVRVLRPGSWEECPPGAQGEVVITTPHRSLGYLDAGEEGTFAGDAYRTGDMGRWDEDGLLHLLGRLDLQVKVRGVRLQPQEIESALRGDAAVRDAAVVGVPDGHDGVRLVAYVLADGAPPSSRRLRDAVGGLLPAAAIPEEFVLLDDLPLLPSGKVDREDLRGRVRGETPPAPPAPAAEPGPAAGDDLRKLTADVCERVIGTAPISVTSDLFDAGVDSISAMEIAALLEDALGREIPLGLVYDHPTVAAIAGYLAGQEEDAR